MDDLQTSDEVTFLVENVEPVVYDVIEAVLKDKVYNETLVQGWVDDICSRVTKELIDTNKPFKYAGEHPTTDVGWIEDVRWECGGPPPLLMWVDFLSAVLVSHPSPVSMPARTQ